MGLEIFYLIGAIMALATSILTYTIVKDRKDSCENCRDVGHHNK